MKKFKAILSDFDGVIGKTMEDNYTAWKYAFLQYNKKIDKKEYFLMEGFNTKKVVEHFFNEKLIPEAITKIINLKEKYYIENNKFSFYDGVESLIPIWKEKGYLLSLVSGGSYERMSKTLDIKFLKMFDVIITGDKVSNCKPHPEPYLNAIKALRMKPSDCVAIENAPVGIESAKRAGLYCIAICSTLEKKYLGKADMIIDSFKKLGDLL